MESLVGRLLESENQLVARLGDLGNPKSVYESIFRSVGTFPISGGWGYSMDNACVIEPNLHVGTSPFDGYSWEKVITEKRIFLELITTRAEGEDFNKLQWNMVSQALVSESDKKYDKLIYTVSGIPTTAWKALEEKANSAQRDGLPLDMRWIKDAEAERQYFSTEYWFDITNFFGSHQ